MMIQYKLMDSVDLYESKDSTTLFNTIGWKTLSIPQETTLVAKGFKADWLTDDNAAEMDRELSNGYFAVLQMISAKMLDARVRENNKTVFSVSPAPEESAYKQVIDGAVTYRLDRYAYMRQSDKGLLLESPLTSSRITTDDGRMTRILHQLCSGLQLDISGKTDKLFMSVLLTLGFAKVAEKKVADNPMDFWEFHDLLFYSRTLGGKNNYPIGGTYHFKDKRPSLPALREPVSNKTIDLPKPSAELLEKLNQPFGKVLTARTSKRNISNSLLTLDELGTFLYTSAHIKKIEHIPEYDEQVTMRPSPSGGARHALEIYTFIRQCQNIEPGAYRYNPQKHCLERVDMNESDYARLLENNPFDFLEGKAPQVILNISARIGRTAWKYESIAYNLINQDMGCLYQTFYLVATALGLAPCALGYVDARKLGETHGLDWREEPFIGSFTIGK